MYNPIRCVRSNQRIVYDIISATTMGALHYNYRVSPAIRLQQCIYGVLIQHAFAAVAPDSVMYEVHISMLVYVPWNIFYSRHNTSNCLWTIFLASSSLFYEGELYWCVSVYWCAYCCCTALAVALGVAQQQCCVTTPGSTPGSTCCVLLKLVSKDAPEKLSRLQNRDDEMQHAVDIPTATPQQACLLQA